MKSIKRALCSVLVCFGAFMFCTGTANAAEGTDVIVSESADNNFVDNNVTDNLATNEVEVSQNADVNAVNLLGENAEVALPVQVGVGEFVQTQPLVQVAEQQLQLTEQQVAVQEITEDAEKVSDDSEKSKKNKKNKKTKKKYTKAELRLVASLIYCESNGQPYAGKLAVGIVVMNRVKAKAFPNTVKGVIYQRSQFSPAHNGTLKRALARYDAGKFKSKNEKQCIKAAKEALEGVKVVKYSGSKKSMKTYHYFSGSLRGARYRIGGHQFK